MANCLHKMNVSYKYNLEDSSKGYEMNVLPKTILTRYYFVTSEACNNTLKAKLLLKLSNI